MSRLFFCTGFLFLSLFGVAQQDSATALPYLRFPTVPPFKLLKADSTGFYTKSDLKKNKATLLFLFNPDCEHCRHETEELLKNIETFRKIQIIMSTNMPFQSMKSFIERYQLDKYPGILVGQDFQSVLPSFFQLRNFPYFAMYDKKGKLLTTFEGAMKLEDLLKVYK